MQPSTWKSHQSPSSSHINRNKNTAGDKAALLRHSWHRPAHSPVQGCLEWETVSKYSRGKSCLHPQNAAMFSALWSHPDISNSTSLLVFKKKQHTSKTVRAIPCGKLAAMPHCRASSLISTSAPAEKNRAFQNLYHKNETCFPPSCSLKQLQMQAKP